MDNNNYPAIYQLADSLSSKFQNEYFTTISISLICLILAAILSIFYVADVGYIYIQSIVLIISFGASVSLGFRMPEKKWYGERALSESVKTLTWRFISKAKPFDTSDRESIELFVDKLQKLLRSNKEISTKSTHLSNGDEITDFMMKIRNQSLDYRMKFYLSSRINDQMQWYKLKSKTNNQKANRLLGVIIFSGGLAIILSFLRINFIEEKIWPTDILIAITTSAIAWSQGKRHRELSASYAQTHFETKLIKQYSLTVSTEEDFSQFVSDSENGFSREHTQWLAKVDN